MASRLSIIIPVYNEKENVSQTIFEIENKVKTLHQIYLIYDSEDDTTLPVAKKLMENRANIYLLKNKYGHGFIGAIRTGFADSAGEIVLVVMADGTDDLSNVDKMVELTSEGYDIVCGSRYMRGGRQIGGPVLKKILSRMAGVSLHYLTGLPTRDATNSFKMYRRSVLAALIIESRTSFALALELIVKAFAKGAKITEMPCVWIDRGNKKSKFKLWQWLPTYLHWYLFALRHKFSK